MTIIFLELLVGAGILAPTLPDVEPLEVCSSKPDVETCIPDSIVLIQQDVRMSYADSVSGRRKVRTDDDRRIHITEDSPKFGHSMHHMYKTSDLFAGTARQRTGAEIPFGSVEALSTGGPLERRTAKRLRKLAELVFIVTRASSGLNGVVSGSTSIKPDHVAAVDMLAKLHQHDPISLEEVQNLMEIAAHSQTAETLAANNALLTADDLAVFWDGTGGRRFSSTFQESKSSAAEFAWLRADTFDGPVGAAWRNGRVNYCFAHDTTQKVRGLFKRVAQHYSRAMPCLTFTDVGLTSGRSADGPELQRCRRSPAIFITSDPRKGCFSHVGMQADRHSQQLQISDPDCASFGTVLHDLGHALGLSHSRTNSSSFSLARGTSHQSVANDDPLSIMFVNDAATSAKLLEIRPSEASAASAAAFGQRVALAESDVRSLLGLYKKEGCVASALTDHGCVDRVWENGKCPALDSRYPWCDSQAAAMHCCACGGGIALQCYAGVACPKSQALFVRTIWRTLIFCIFVTSLCWFLLFRLTRTAQNCGGMACRAARRPDCYDLGSDCDPQENEELEQMFSFTPCSMVGVLDNMRRGAVAKAKAFAKTWVYTPPPEGGKLTREALDRWRADFAPFGGGFSSGRSAPPTGLPPPATAGWDALSEGPVVCGTASTASSAIAGAPTEEPQQAASSSRGCTAESNAQFAVSTRSPHFAPSPERPKEQSTKRVRTQDTAPQ